jgi:hypothetical protein
MASVPAHREQEDAGDPDAKSYRNLVNHIDNVIHDKPLTEKTFRPTRNATWLMIPTTTPTTERKEVSACPLVNRPIHPEARPP